MKHSNPWCGVCDEVTEHIGAQCVVCQCTTPLCPDCEEPLTLETDQDDSTNLNWSCGTCGIDYGRGRFSVPKHILAQHRKAIADNAQRQATEDERARLADWNATMRGEQRLRYNG